MPARHGGSHRLAPLALTMGDPAGIGGEIAVKAWRVLKDTGPPFFLIDDPERVRALGADVAAIEAPDGAHAAFPRALPVIDIGARIAAAPGRSDPSTAPQVIASIDRAVSLALSGSAAAIVTNPIRKSTLSAAGFGFPGHTEYLAALTADAPMPGGRRRGPAMLLACEGLRTCPATIHTPLKDVAARLTADLIVDCATIILEALEADFGIAGPRLAIAGLNPHAGEGGTIGREESETLEPAIARLRKVWGERVFGPLAGDSLFHAAARRTYDAALCMYHDQALIPIKTLAFDEAVNVTLGLPIVRTSPDHGVALDIAGRGIARPDSLIAAIRLAAELAARRAGA
jgi:4-hydroxythreonine-4-phosphate dehydrogenase